MYMRYIRHMITCLEFTKEHLKASERTRKIIRIRDKKNKLLCMAHTSATHHPANTYGEACWCYGSVSWQQGQCN